MSANKRALEKPKQVETGKDVGSRIPILGTDGPVLLLVTVYSGPVLIL